jgi:hypothetical protein
LIFDYTLLEEKGFNRFEIISIFFSAADPGLMPKVLKGLSVSRRTLPTPIYTRAGEERLQVSAKKVFGLLFAVFRLMLGGCRHMGLEQ